MNAIAEPVQPAAATDVDALRDALQHIMLTARASRSSTRRIRWIEERAKRALAGEPFKAWDDIELPPKVTENTVEKLKKKLAAVKRHNGQLVAASEAIVAALDGVNVAPEVSSLLRDLHVAAVDATWVAGIMVDPEAPVPGTAKPQDLRIALDLARRSTLGARRAGRAEALAILLEQDPEAFPDDFTGSHPIADTGDYGTHWHNDKLRELLDLDGEEPTLSLIDRLDGIYWEQVYHLDEMRTALLWTLWHHQGFNSPVGQPARRALAMGRAQRLTDDQIRQAKVAADWRGHEKPEFPPTEDQG